MVVVPSEPFIPRPSSRPPAARPGFELAQALIQRFSLPSLVLDDRMRVIVVNEAMGEILGSKCDDLVSRDFLELIVELELGAAFEAFEGISRRREERRLRFAPRARLELVLELELERIASTDASLVLGTVSPAVSAPIETRSVVISTSPELGERVGAATREASGSPGPGVCRVLCDREACAVCPASMVSEREPIASRVLETQDRDDHYVVVTARRLSRDRVSMSSVRIDDATRSRLAEARLDHVAKRAGLSARERQVMSYLLMGLEIRDIAEVLGITVRTVRFHQYNLLEKLGADSRADLVRFVL